MKHFQLTHKQHQLPYWLAVAALFLTLVLPSVAHAFDGNRKGFVLGFGLGVTPVARLTVKNTSIDETRQGTSLGILIGYAWDNRNMLVYEGSGTIYSSSSVPDSYVIQMLDAFRWYHYWGAEKARFFTMVGVGEMVLGTEYTHIDGTGFGYCAGVGYEIFKQVQISFNYQGGHTSNEYGVKANLHHLYFMAQVVAY
jgi:hypothetical protein